MSKDVTHIEVWKDTRDRLKVISKEEGVSMKKMLDMLVKGKAKCKK